MQHFLTRTMNNYLMTAALAAVLAGCAQPAPTRPASGSFPPPAAAPSPALDAPASAQKASTGLPHYKCDQGIEFTVRFSDDSAVVDAGPLGNDVLLRDAGGTTPQQTVFSNKRMRAEFGLGADAREAVLHYASPALRARCVLG